MFDALHEVSGRGFSQRGEEEARRFLFKRLDNVEVGGVRGVRDAYSAHFIRGKGAHCDDYRDARDGNEDGQYRDALSVEHCWPIAYYEHRRPMRQDLHQLMPASEFANSKRSSWPYGEVKGRPLYVAGGGTKLGDAAFEPPDWSKGKVARAMLYFFTRYHDQGIGEGPMPRGFWTDSVETLLSWNRSHPPDGEERRRNDLIESFQGNRNPFIDDPELADRVGLKAWQEAWEQRAQLGRPRPSPVRRLPDQARPEPPPPPAPKPAPEAPSAKGDSDDHRRDIRHGRRSAKQRLRTYVR